MPLPMPGMASTAFSVVDDVGNLLGMALDSLGGAAVGADAEAVVALDLHEVGGLVEDVGDGLVVHGQSL